MTDGVTLTLTGIANDAGGVASVRVNGTSASSSDGFGTWRAVVPLLFGTNRLSLEPWIASSPSISPVARARP